jgi:hypothetical protein
MDRATLLQQPEGTTDSPYSSGASVSHKRPHSDSGSVPLDSNKKMKTDSCAFSAEKAAALAMEARKNGGADQFRFQGNNRGSAVPRGHPRGPFVPGEPGSKVIPNNNLQRGPPPRINCWFCLATVEIEKHLIAGIGNEIYLATPKGSMVRNHILIIPIQHVASSSLLDDGCLEEVDDVMNSITKLYKSTGHVPVVCERYVITKGANHGHLQVFPVPVDLTDAVKETFTSKGSKYGMTFEDIPVHTRIKDLVSKGMFCCSPFCNFIFIAKINIFLKMSSIFMRKCQMALSYYTVSLVKANTLLNLDVKQLQSF